MKTGLYGTPRAHNAKKLSKADLAGIREMMLAGKGNDSISRKFRIGKGRAERIRAELGIAKFQYQEVAMPRLPMPPASEPLLFAPRPVVAAAVPVVAWVSRPIPPARGCQFPGWADHERPRFRADGGPLLCGDVVDRGSYCSEHGEDCYVPRKRDMEEAA